MKKLFFMLVVVAFALAGEAKGRPLRQAQDRPNVLFIMSDDLNTALSGFGHPQCKTPKLDKLAGRGMRFENMHCQYPVCGASRSSIMSGLYPYTNGTLGNSGTLRGNMPDVVTMSQLFRNNGYRVGRVSKIYHMGIPPEIIAGTAERDDPQSWDEVVNIKAPDSLQGDSLLPLLKDPASKDWKKDTAFTISRSGGESIRTHDWRFTQWSFGASGMELYDLKNDPGEFTNLAGNPKYATQLERLKKQLEAKRQAAGYSADKYSNKKTKKKK